MKKLTLETTQPFQGLPEIVAYDEGLFEREGLGIEWADRDKGAKHERVATNIVTPRGLDPFLSHGKMLESGKADMYNACEWGNYCRVEATTKGSRQVGRRAIVTFAAIVVGPTSSIYTPQQLANVPVAVPFISELTMSLYICSEDFCRATWSSCAALHLPVIYACKRFSPAKSRL